MESTRATQGKIHLSHLLQRDQHGIIVEHSRPQISIMKWRFGCSSLNPQLPNLYKASRGITKLGVCQVFVLRSSQRIQGNEKILEFLSLKVAKAHITRKHYKEQCRQTSQVTYLRDVLRSRRWNSWSVETRRKVFLWPVSLFATFAILLVRWLCFQIWPIDC